MVLVYGVVQAGLRSWHSGQALIPILVGLGLLALFGLIESRWASDPLIPFKDLTKPLNVANGIVLLFSAALFPMWFLSSLYLQQVLGLSPLHAGLCFLPMALTIMFVARSAGKLVSRFGVRAVLGGGLTMMAFGMLLFTKIAASGSPILYVVLPGVLTAAGIGMSIVPSTIAATQGAKEGQAGLASGLVNTSRQVGGGLGLAVLITLATTALEPPHRPGPWRAPGAHRRIPARVFHRRRPVRRGRAGHVRARAQGGRRRPGPDHEADPDRDRRDRGRRRVRRDRVHLRRLPRRPDRRVRDRQHLQLRDRAGAPPARDSRGHQDRLEQARARLHLDDELLRPQPPADHGPERAADPRQQPPAGVVQAGADERRRRQPQPPGLQRQAGPRVVAGRGHQHRRHRAGRVRDRQPALPDGGDAARHRRLGADAARDRDPRPLRVGHREQEPPDGPVEIRRRLQRGADRLSRPGVRPEHRQAGAELGRAGSHPAQRFARDDSDQRVPVGRLPRQCHRRAGRRVVRGVDARHLGHLQGQHHHRQDRVDARRTALELQARPRRRLPMAARRGHVSRLALDHDV